MESKGNQALFWKKRRERLKFTSCLSIIHFEMPDLSLLMIVTHNVIDARMTDF